MNEIISTLEEIGQSTSLKQFDNPLDMLNSVNVSENFIDVLNNSTQEYVCALVPEDDDDDADKKVSFN